MTQRPEEWRNIFGVAAASCFGFLRCVRHLQTRGPLEYVPILSALLCFGCPQSLDFEVPPDITELLDGSQCSAEETRACYSGPDGTEGIGLCAAGVERCVDGSWTGSCEGEVVPTQELCNDSDHDCDGLKKNGFPVQSSCSAGVGVCQRDGVYICNSVGTGVICDARPADPPTDEETTCDGLDNDCDIEVDEGLFLDCYLGPTGTKDVGSCHGGQAECIRGIAGSCVDQIVPTIESCDTQDNDCDGDIDEDFPAGRPCTAGFGSCQETGVFLCDLDGKGVHCSVNYVGYEVCDNELDDDCNGAVDEGCVCNPQTSVAHECGSDVGLCEVGEQVCVEDVDEWIWSACEGGRGPVAEVCDTLDNDCDGDSDEDFPQLAEICEVGVGACVAPGVFVCNQAGDDVTCSGVPLSPTVETCDGVDNDCDHLVDEGSGGGPLTESCYTGNESTKDVGICHSGQKVCENEDWSACEGQQLPLEEVCDGQDNDCDGAVDDGVCAENMVYVPRGLVYLGCDNAVECSNPGPATIVELTEPFLIDMYEVTRQQYDACVISPDHWCSPRDNLCGLATSELDSAPVTCVTQTQARRYCSWLDKTLCSSPQWVMAARGGEAWAYPWGNDPATCDLAVMNENSHPGCGTSSYWVVGSKPDGVSPFGVFDMAGNVREWTNAASSREFEDIDGAELDVAGLDGTGDTSYVSQASNPINGGGFRDTWDRLCVCSIESMGLWNSYKADDLGFRCCASPNHQ